MNDTILIIVLLGTIGGLLAGVFLIRAFLLWSLKINERLKVEKEILYYLREIYTSNKKEINEENIV